MSDVYIHPTAEVHPSARIGEGTKIWSHAQVREDVEIGSECIVGRNVYVDFGVTIGSRVKIQNNVSVYHGVTLEDGVFIGPHVCFTNDFVPRAITPDGRLKGAEDWEVTPIHVGYGASLGANSTIVPGVTIGAFALVGSGAVVTRDVPDQGLVYGNPARLHGYVCRCGRKLIEMRQTPEGLRGTCPSCQTDYTVQQTGI
jgi:UDP-2-acetamido-3-amino-2,3-dideoxy-glucuronate N-acetyltransferase